MENKDLRLIKFKTVDDWNRPIFEVVDRKYYLSDVNNLFDYGTTEAEIFEFYKDKTLNQHLTYHGRRIDSEPGGDSMSHLEFKLVEA